MGCGNSTPVHKELVSAKPQVQIQPDEKSNKPEKKQETNQQIISMDKESNKSSSSKYKLKHSESLRNIIKPSTKGS